MRCSRSAAASLPRSPESRRLATISWGESGAVVMLHLGFGLKRTGTLGLTRPLGAVVHGARHLAGVHAPQGSEECRQIAGRQEPGNLPIDGQDMSWEGAE